MASTDDGSGGRDAAGDGREDWATVDLGPLGHVACPPGWTAEGPTADGRGAAAIAPDGAARLVVHAVVHGAEATAGDFEGRMRAAAERVIAHLAGKAGAETPEVLTIAGAGRPILEIAAAFFDDADRPRARVRQWHALAPLDAEAERIAVLAFSLMTPALHPPDDSAAVAAGFRIGLRAAAATLSNGGKGDGATSPTENFKC